MQRVLIHRAKGGTFVYDVSTKELSEGAFLELFKLLDFDGCYETGLDSTELQLVTQARHGNTKAARALLLLRNGAEHESFDVVDLQYNPASEQEGRKVLPVRLLDNKLDRGQS